MSYREQMLRVREDVIVDVVNRLLASKGYDLMTVDEVASEAGMAKASLYKHFTSKEELAAAAMVRILDRTLAQMDALAAVKPGTPIQQLRALVRWTMQLQLSGEMPTLPSQNSKLVGALRDNRDYMDRVMTLSDRLGALIVEAQEAGQLNPALPPELILYSLYARACDPVLPMLKAGGQYPDEQMMDWIETVTFQGLAKPPRR